MDDAGEIIKMMTGNLHHLDVNVKHVIVKVKSHARSEKKQCYNNSWRYIQDNYKEDAQYILGYVIVHGIPIEHAWVKVGGQHFDVTLSDSDATYYEVVEVPQAQLDAYVEKEQHAPDLYSLNRFASKKK